MRADRRSVDGLLAALVLVHLAVTLIHAWAHSGANVTMSPIATVFIVGVILVAPLVGLGVLWFRSIGAGAWLLGVSLAGAFAFGVVNHFIVESADHVSHIAGQWRVVFGVTAALLALTEAAGSGLAFWRVTQSRVP
jgi:predicted outer membrane lipoprotein